MFWIFLYCFVSFHALTKQFVFNKIFNLLYKRSSLFILHMKQSLWSQVQAKDTKLQPPSSTCLDRYLAVTEGRLTKLFIGGSGLILRPAQPPFRCHKPLEGRMPSQRLRPALPMIRLLWSMLDTRPTVTMQVSSTCVSVTKWHQLKKKCIFGVFQQVLMWKTLPGPAASMGAELLLFHWLYAAKRHWCLKTNWAKSIMFRNTSAELITDELSSTKMALFTSTLWFHVHQSFKKLHMLVWLPAARMYSDPFPGWSSKLFTSVPTGRAPSGYASPSLAETAKSTAIMSYHILLNG